MRRAEGEQKLGPTESRLSPAFRAERRDGRPRPRQLLIIIDESALHPLDEIRGLSELRAGIANLPAMIATIADRMRETLSEGLRQRVV